jgi:hypothetical protein
LRAHIRIFVPACDRLVFLASPPLFCSDEPTAAVFLFGVPVHRLPRLSPGFDPRAPWLLVTTLANKRPGTRVGYRAWGCLANAPNRIHKCMFYQIYCTYKQYITWLGPCRWGICEPTVKLVVRNCTRCWTGDAEDAFRRAQPNCDRKGDQLSA